MSDLNVTRIKGRTPGSVPYLTDGVIISGISTITDATQSTSTSTGALIVHGGVGIAKSLHVGGNVSVGGTLTYEDVTNIDSIGVVTARDGIKTNVSPSITIRDGSTEKGYIGFNGNDPFIGRKNGVGLVFQNNKIRPADGDDGTPSTNTVDLGEPTYKFKDGYFEGNLYGNGSNLSGIDAAPTVTGTASGTIAAHKAVIVKSDGKISVVEGASAGKSSSGNSVWAEATNWWPKDTSIAITPNATTVALIYQESASPYHSFLRIGTTSINGSSSTITWGTAVQVTADGGGNNWKISEANTEQHLINIDNTRFLLLYSNVTNGGSSPAYAKLFSVSGTTATFGTEYALNGGTNTNQHDMVQIPGTNKVFAVFRQASNSYIKAQILDCGSTGLTVTGGSPVSNTYQMEYPTPAWDSTNNQGYIAMRKGGEMQIAVVAVSGTTVSSISSSINSNYSMASHKPALAYSSEDNMLATMFEDGGSADTRIVTITPSSNSATWSTQVNMSVNYYGWKMAYDASVNKISAIFLKASGGTGQYTTYATHITFNIGNAPNFTTPVQLNPSQGGQDQDRGLCIVPSSVGGLSLYAFARSNSTPTQGVVVFDQLDATNMTTGNFIGFSDAGYTDGQTAKVKIVGNTTTQSGLTPGKKYYVQSDGSISDTAGTPSVPCGRALSSTQLLVAYS